MSYSVQPHRQQPTRLLCPWDSPGKNTGVGCHVLLQCMKVKSESEVAQSCPTLSDPMDCSLPGSSTHGIFQARVLEWVTIAFSKLVPNSSSWFVKAWFICPFLVLSIHVPRALPAISRHLIKVSNKKHSSLNISSWSHTISHTKCVTHYKTNDIPDW